LSGRFGGIPTPFRAISTPIRAILTPIRAVLWSFWRHFTTILYKRARYASRDSGSALWQAILPPLIVMAGTALLKYARFVTHVLIDSLPRML